MLPETSGILDKIGKYDAEDLKDPALKDVRNELFYLLGRHFYAKGKFAKAVALFRRVPRTSKHFIKAKFFEGVTFVRKSEGRPAVAAFKEILIIGKEKPKHFKKSTISKFVANASNSEPKRASAKGLPESPMRPVATSRAIPSWPEINPRKSARVDSRIRAGSAAGSPSR